MQLVQSTQQQKLVAGVISFPTEDLFVVYKGVNTNGDFSMDVRVNPLITPVWVGFGLLMVGVLIATAGRRGAKRKFDEEPSGDDLPHEASAAKVEGSSVALETVADVVTADGVVEAVVKGAVDVALGSASVAAASKADEKKREEA